MSKKNKLGNTNIGIVKIKDVGTLPKILERVFLNSKYVYLEADNVPQFIKKRNKKLKNCFGKIMENHFEIPKTKEKRIKLFNDLLKTNPIEMRSFNYENGKSIYVSFRKYVSVISDKDLIIYL